MVFNGELVIHFYLIKLIVLHLTMYYNHPGLPDYNVLPLNNLNDTRVKLHFSINPQYGEHLLNTIKMQGNRAKYLTAIAPFMALCHFVQSSVLGSLVWLCCDEL